MRTVVLLETSINCYLSIKGIIDLKILNENELLIQPNSLSKEFSMSNATNVQIHPSKHELFICINYEIIIFLYDLHTDLYAFQLFNLKMFDQSKLSCNNGQVL